MTVLMRDFPVKFPGCSFGPTRELLERFQTYKKEGLASAIASHITTRAEDTGPAPKDGTDHLLRIVDPDYKAVDAIGAAWTQLARASKRNYRVIAIPPKLEGLTRADMRKGIILTNPTFEVVDATPHVQFHFCLTFPGWGAEVAYPRIIRIMGDELAKPLVLDQYASSAGCHECDHINGTNSILRAIEQRTRLHYRPPEERDAWMAMKAAGQLHKWPWQIDLSKGKLDYLKFLHDVLDLEQYMKFMKQL